MLPQVAPLSDEDEQQRVLLRYVSFTGCLSLVLGLIIVLAFTFWMQSRGHSDDNGRSDREGSAPAAPAAGPGNEDGMSDEQAAVPEACTLITIDDAEAVLGTPTELTAQRHDPAAMSSCRYEHVATAAPAQGGPSGSLEQDGFVAVTVRPDDVITDEEREALLVSGVEALPGVGDFAFRDGAVFRMRSLSTAVELELTLTDPDTTAEQLTDAAVRLLELINERILAA